MNKHEFNKKRLMYAVRLSKYMAPHEYRILKENKAVFKFLNNVYSFGSLLNITIKSDNTILNAFRWSSTPEGHKYWLDLYHKKLTNN